MERGLIVTPGHAAPRAGTAVGGHGETRVGRPPDTRSAVRGRTPEPQVRAPQPAGEGASPESGARAGGGVAGVPGAREAGRGGIRRAALYLCRAPRAAALPPAPHATAQPRHGSVAAAPGAPTRPALTAPAPSAPTVSLQPRPPPPLLAAAMESSAITPVPVFAPLSNPQSRLPAVASAAASAAPRLCHSHVTAGDPGAGAGQGPAPS